ncbi:MAG TPA: hypothetical protein VII56_14400 [Rhizomicrobium sp.]
MPESTNFMPFSSAFTFVKAARKPGEMQDTPKSANAHEVGRVLMAGDRKGDNLLAAHAIYGMADLLTIVRGNDPDDLIKQVHTRIRKQDIGANSYIYGSGSYPITSHYGKPLSRATFAPDGRKCAWVLATVGVADPAEVLADGLLKREGIEFVAPVFGDPYDLFIFVKHDTFEGVQWIVDEEIRPLRNFISTSTLIVTQQLQHKP